MNEQGELECEKVWNAKNAYLTETTTSTATYSLLLLTTATTINYHYITHPQTTITTTTTTTPIITTMLLLITTQTCQRNHPNCSSSPWWTETKCIRIYTAKALSCLIWEFNSHAKWHQALLEFEKNVVPAPIQTNTRKNKQFNLLNCLGGPSPNNLIYWIVWGGRAQTI